MCASGSAVVVARRAAAACLFALVLCGLPRAAHGLQQARTVAFSRAGGTFAEPFMLELRGPVGSMIRYTTDGTEPDAASGHTYTAPIRVTSSVRIRAVARGANGAAEPASESYIRLSPELAGYTSTLPILVIENFGAGPIPRKGWNQIGSGIRQVPRQAAVWATFERVNGVSSLAAAPQMISAIGIRGRGAFSSEWPQKPYNVEAIDERGGERAVSPLGLPAHSDWVLYYPDADTIAVEPAGLGLPLNDPTLLFNSFAWELSAGMDRYAVRFRWVEAFINEDGAPLGLQHRRGVYAIVEKVSRGRDRLAFRRLSPDGSTGGWLLGINRMDPEPETGFPAPNGALQPQSFHTAGRNRVLETPPNERGRGDDQPRSGNAFINFENPNGYAITPAQRAAIEEWFRAFEDVLWDDDVWRDAVRGYRRFIDVGEFIDYFIVNELTQNGDGIGLSMYPWKGDDGLLRMGPVWDFNWAAYFNRTIYSATGVYVDPDPRAVLMHHSWALWYGRLFTDPDFHSAYLRRWYALRAGLLSADTMHAIIDRQAAEIGPEKAVLNGVPSAAEWYARLDHMKRFLAERAAWLDEQYRCPAWSRQEDEGVRCRVLVTAETAPLLASGPQCLDCAAAPLLLEHTLDGVRVTGSQPAPQPPAAPAWRFDGAAAAWQAVQPWNPTVATARIERAGGMLRVSLGDSTRNLARVPVGGVFTELPTPTLAGFSGLLVRARGTGITGIGPRYNLRSGRGTAQDGPSPFRSGGPDTAFVSDGSLRSYRLRLDWAPDTVRQVGLWLYGDTGAVEIESIALEPVEVPFRDAPYGQRLVRSRSVLYTHTDGRLTYRVTIPEGGWLGLGYGVLRRGAPVTFMIGVRLNGKEEHLHEITWDDPATWSDHVLDLRRFAGRDIELILEAKAATAGVVALWAEPTLGGSPRPGTRDH